jgi:hypothetical protein
LRGRIQSRHREPQHPAASRAGHGDGVRSDSGGRRTCGPPREQDQAAARTGARSRRGRSMWHSCPQGSSTHWNSTRVGRAIGSTDRIRISLPHALHITCSSNGPPYLCCAESSGRTKAGPFKIAQIVLNRPANRTGVGSPDPGRRRGVRSGNPRALASAGRGS